MSTLTRWNPFKSMARYDPIASFDDIFRGLGTRPIWRDMEMAPEIRIDVSEEDKAFRVKAEMPGVEKNDIEVSVDGNMVSISAEVKRESKQKEGEKDLYTERYYGKMFRSFTLPNDLDSTKTEAHYEGGVLTLMLPKKANGSARKISVS